MVLPLDVLVNLLLSTLFLLSTIRSPANEVLAPVPIIVPTEEVLVPQLLTRDAVGPGDPSACYPWR